MRRDEYDGPIESLREKQRAIWEAALEKFLRWRSCQLGLCNVVDAAEKAARTALGGEAQEKAAQYVARLRVEREEPWMQAARAVEQIEIAIAVLGKKREGLL